MGEAIMGAGDIMGGHTHKSDKGPGPKAYQHIFLNKHNSCRANAFVANFTEFRPKMLKVFWILPNGHPRIRLADQNCQKYQMRSCSIITHRRKCATIWKNAGHLEKYKTWPWNCPGRAWLSLGSAKSKFNAELVSIQQEIVHYSAILTGHTRYRIFAFDLLWCFANINEWCANK